MIVAAEKESARKLPQEFETLFVEHHDLVYRAAYRVTGNAEDAEDVLQTLFLRLLRRECAPEIAKNLKAYLHRAAINVALDIVRSRKRTVPTDDLSLHDGQPAPDRHRRSSELQACLRAALAELSPTAAQMFVLRHIEGYSNGEIAQMMGTTRGTVAVLLFRARLRVRKTFRQFLGGRP
jgi:RNA polymerase sigma-70 factor (ECF subfamily)